MRGFQPPLDATPQQLDDITLDPALVITVCDRAHEEVGSDPSWWHWSTPDPVEDPRPDAFDRAVRRLHARIRTLPAAR